MIRKTILLLYLFIGISNIYSQNELNMKYNKLTPEEEAVILHKGTEYPGTGELLHNKANGIYVCKQCDAPLYTSKSKFESNCGWPSFDEEIEGAVQRLPDADGRRTEIVCARCKGHLGHIFFNEGFTPKNTRHCVNSISMKFIPEKKQSTRKAYFASGCFWGTEYYFQELDGVEKTAVGFMGGNWESPTYKEVCTGKTGHLETVEIVYDPDKVSYEELVKYFFETHNFTQTNGQGPDIGSQYLSFIFYSDESEKEVAEKYIDILTKKGYKVATQLAIASTFWKAEDYHQQYYENNGQRPYCHRYTTIFEKE